MDGFPSNRASAVFQHQFLNHIECCRWNNRFMGVFYPHPFRFILCTANFDLMIRSCGLSLYQSSCVHLVFQNPVDCYRTPDCPSLLAKSGLIPGTAMPFIFIWRKNSILIQPVSYLCRTESVNLHPENTLHNESCGFVNDQLILIFL